MRTPELASRERVSGAARASQSLAALGGRNPSPSGKTLGVLHSDPSPAPFALPSALSTGMKVCVTLDPFWRHSLGSSTFRAHASRAGTED